MEDEINVIRCTEIRRIVNTSIHSAQLYYHFFPMRKTILVGRLKDRNIFERKHFIRLIQYGHFEKVIEMCGIEICCHRVFITWAVTFFPQKIQARNYVKKIVSIYFTNDDRLFYWIGKLNLPREMVIDEIFESMRNFNFRDACILAKKMKKYFGKDKWNAKLNALLSSGNFAH